MVRSFQGTKVAVVALALSAFGLLAWAASEGAKTGIPDGSKTSHYVKVVVTAEKPDDKGVQRFTVTLRVDERCCLFANPTRNEDLDMNKTTVQVNIAGKDADAKITYPLGITRRDMEIGDYEIYQGMVVIHGEVKRAAGDTSPLEVLVRMQAQFLPPTI